MSTLKAGDIVRFTPGLSYYHDWLNDRFQVEPGALGQVVRAFNPGFDKWAEVVFPPLVGTWQILVEELERVEVPRGDETTAKG